MISARVVRWAELIFGFGWCAFSACLTAAVLLGDGRVDLGWFLPVVFVGGMVVGLAIAHGSAVAVFRGRLFDVAWPWRGARLAEIAVVRVEVVEEEDWALVFAVLRNGSERRVLKVVPRMFGDLSGAVRDAESFAAYVRAQAKRAGEQS